MSDHEGRNNLDLPPSRGDGGSDEPAPAGQGSGAGEQPQRLAGGIPVLVRRRRRRGVWKRIRSWIRHHRAISTLIALMLVLVLGLLAWLIYLNSQLGDVTRFDLDLDNRPDRVPGEQLNILVLGVDDLDYQRNVGPDVYKMLESGDWERGAFRSDTMMLVHLEADRRAAQLVSVPRDSYVDIPGEGRSKINAAFSWGGPELAAATVEKNFGVYVDHVVVVNFGGFEDITNILGGVDIFFAEETQADGKGRTWSPGFHRLNGTDALFYSRQRYDLPRGDFDRIQRQQNYLRALLDRAVESGTVTNPIRLTRLARNLSDLVAVDAGLTNGKLRDIALDSRNLRSNSIRFVTVPNDGSATIDGASIVKVRLKAAREMFDAIQRDQFESWYAQNEVDELPSVNEVD